MGAKGTITGKWLGMACFACLATAACGGSGGGGGSSTHEEPGTDTNATTPAETPKGDEAATAPASGDEPSGPAAPLTLAPACGTPGYRVVLKLGLTSDHRVPSCFDVDAARVTFAPNKPAQVTLMGPSSDGFCALDVEIPKGAETGKVQVAIGRDAFESDVAFGIPCP